MRACEEEVFLRVKKDPGRNKLFLPGSVHEKEKEQKGE